MNADQCTHLPLVPEASRVRLKAIELRLAELATTFPDRPTPEQKLRLVLAAAALGFQQCGHDPLAQLRLSSPNRVQAL